jgi:Lon protease-like protein
MFVNRIGARCATSLIVLLVPLAASSQPQSLSSPADKATALVLPADIPLFPLPETTLFPRVSRLFLIFEPRYRDMVRDAQQGDRIIGMVTLRPGWELDYDGRPPVYAIGCAGVMTDVRELPDGRFVIVLRGLVKFRIISEDQRRIYRLARVEPLLEFTPAAEDRLALGAERRRLETLLASVEPDLEPLPARLDDEEAVNTLAQLLDLEPEDRQALLERDGALARARALVDLLRPK